MKMEDPGPEAAKRPRLEHYGDSQPVQRINEQQPEPPLLLPMHNYPGSHALRPPSAYSRPLPPSPYNPGHDPRVLHEHPAPPPQGGYEAHRPGYTTPGRDRPPPPDTNPLHGIPGTSAQSPERPLGAALRPTSTAFEAAAQHYGHPPGHEGVEPPPSYPAPEHLNGMYHALPVHQGHVDPAHAPPPPPHPPPSHPPSHPHSHPPASAYGEPHIQHGPPYSAGGPFSAPPAAVPWINNRQYAPPPKKATRAQQACEMCRHRKARCDEVRPSCGYCKENGTVCIYKEMQAPKADRAQKEIMDQLRKSEDNIEHLRSCFNNLDERFDRVEKSLTEIAKVIRVDRRGSEPRETKVESPVSPEVVPPGLSLQPSFSNAEPSRMDPMYQLPSSLDIDTVEETSAGVSIHIDHTTGAHRLFKWRSIADLFSGRQINENYVMENEERKGLLRLYGKGQGIDRYDGAQNGNPSSPASSSSGDDVSRSPSNSSDDDLWGSDLGYPHVVDGKFFNNEKDHPGGLTLEGNLKLDRQTAVALLNSYLDNIHIFHPFLDKARLTRMVEKVYRDYNPGSSHNTFQPSSVSPFAPHSRPLKRKHSGDEAALDARGNAAPRQTPAEPRLTRRISTAIVLLVMALGKICLHSSPLPGFASETARDGPTSSHATSPNNHTLSPATAVSSPMSAAELRGRSTQIRAPASDSSSHRAPRKGDRNVDVIPGLAYFAKASDILGGLQGHDLQFVQANLLAGLYTAQLACVIESWTWIQHACRCCYFVVRDPTFARERDPKRVDLIRFAYLTCLQLESDILAEMDLHPSGIQNIDPQNTISLPKGVVDDAMDLTSNQRSEKSSEIMVYYSFQLHLRKMLNDWQKFLYPPGGSELLDQKFKPEDDTFSMSDRNGCEQTLALLRQYMDQDPKLRWDDNEEPASDINAARLRGKYYGAKYIVHRPFLYYALHHFDASHVTDEAIRKLKTFDRDPAQVPLQDRPAQDASKRERADWLVFQMLISCRMCVEAAKRSTTAFDGVLKHKRLMVTNIFGTAHAQFGNMLVLAATYNSKHLSWLIEKSELLTLLNRTICFLQSLAPISTTLATDASLLLTIKDKIEGPARGSIDIPHHASSFGSMASH